MNRSALREQVFLLLFQIDFYSAAELPAQASLYLETLPDRFSADDLYELRSRFDLVTEHLKEIDRLINEKTSGWTTDRMGKAELTILRLAVYEIVHDDEVPTAVAINEAVELAKRYGQDESAAFVNGVLAHFA